jgi:hypothetical protein
VVASVATLTACMTDPHTARVIMRPTSVTATTTTTTYLPTTTTTDPTVYAQWSRVAVCEEGGWIGYAGPAYPDSLGISAVNYYANGGNGDMTPAAQIAVAQRVEANAGLAGYVPDQYGCAPW